MDATHAATLLRWAAWDRQKAEQYEATLAEVARGMRFMSGDTDTTEQDCERLRRDASDLRLGASELSELVTDAGLAAAFAKAPPELGNEVRNVLRAEMIRRGLA